MLQGNRPGVYRHGDAPVWSVSGVRNHPDRQYKKHGSNKPWAEKPLDSIRSRRCLIRDTTNDTALVEEWLVVVVWVWSKAPSWTTTTYDEEIPKKK